MDSTSKRRPTYVLSLSVRSNRVAGPLAPNAHPSNSLAPMMPHVRADGTLTDKHSDARAALNHALQERKRLEWPAARE
jgi:hypothetical protein